MFLLIFFLNEEERPPHSIHPPHLSYKFPPAPQYNPCFELIFWSEQAFIGNTILKKKFKKLLGQ